MNGYSTAGWENFLVAETGAAAALAGLLFVSVSINIGKILSYPGLPGRAAEAVLLLFNVLVASTLGLIPQSSSFLGTELLAISLFICLVILSLQIRDARRPEQRAWWSVTRIVTSQLGLLPIIAAGVSLLAHRGGGLYWLGAGVIFSFGAALIDAWVLLVEILR
jgi:modulator of FtsH protease